MSRPAPQSVTLIFKVLGIQITTLYAWRKTWRFQWEVVPASENDRECWSAAESFTVVLDSAGLNTTEFGAFCRERGLYPVQVDRWRQATPTSAVGQACRRHLMPMPCRC